MLKKIAAAALMACLVPAAALACDGMPAAEQRAVKPVTASDNKELIAQLDLKNFKKAGDDAAKNLKKESDKTQLNNNLQNAANTATTNNTSSKSAVKPRPKAKQLSTPKK